MEWSPVLAVFFGAVMLAFLVGLLIGGRMADYEWRQKAAAGTRKLSGSALYEVQKVFDFKSPGGAA